MAAGYGTVKPMRQLEDFRRAHQEVEDSALKEKQKAAPHIISQEVDFGSWEEVRITGE